MISANGEQRGEDRPDQAGLGTSTLNCSISPLSTCCCTWSSSDAWVPSSQNAGHLLAVVEVAFISLVAVDEGDLPDLAGGDVLGHGRGLDLVVAAVGRGYCRRAAPPTTARTIHNHGPLNMRFTGFSRTNSSERSTVHRAASRSHCRRPVQRSPVQASGTCSGPPRAAWTAGRDDDLRAGTTKFVVPDQVLSASRQISPGVARRFGFRRPADKTRSVQPTSSASRLTRAAPACRCRAGCGSARGSPGRSRRRTRSGCPSRRTSRRPAWSAPRLAQQRADLDARGLREVRLEVSQTA